MKTRQAKDWWTVTFCDPVSWAILSIIGDWKWVTPWGITVLSLPVRIAGAVMIALGEEMNLVWGVLLIQVGVIMDHMDGNLARYRKTTSITGAFMDRIFDGLSFLAIVSAMGWLAVRQGSPTYLLFIAPLAGAFYLVICYMYWSYAYEELKVTGGSKMVNPGAIVSNLVDISTWKIILEGQKRILKLHHIDYYFWVSFFVLIGKPGVGVWIMFVVLGVNVHQRFKQRYRNLANIE